MRGEYRYVTLAAEQETASEEQIKAGGESTADLGTFHFLLPDEQRILQIRDQEGDEEEDEEEEDEQHSRLI